MTTREQKFKRWFFTQQFVLNVRFKLELIFIHICCQGDQGGGFTSFPDPDPQSNKDTERILGKGNFDIQKSQIIIFKICFSHFKRLVLIWKPVRNAVFNIWDIKYVHIKR